MDTFPAELIAEIIQHALPSTPISLDTSTHRRILHHLTSICRKFRTTTLHIAPLDQIAIYIDTCPHNHNALNFLAFLVEHARAPLKVSIRFNPLTLDPFPPCPCIALLLTRPWNTLTVQGTNCNPETAARVIDAFIPNDALVSVSHVKIQAEAHTTDLHIEHLFIILSQKRAHGNLTLDLWPWRSTNLQHHRFPHPLPQVTTLHLTTSWRNILPILYLLPNLHSATLTIERPDAHAGDLYRYTGPRIRLPLLENLTIVIKQSLPTTSAKIADTVHGSDCFSKLISPVLRSLTLWWNAHPGPSHCQYLQPALDTFLTQHRDTLCLFFFHDYANDEKGMTSLLRSSCIHQSIFRYQAHFSP
ncbi:hypothetical protein VNI00_009709 [Paramarasmius palmivorus]|uniref:F-box domain-containing protein n=1 Tax=Paramarasmius palmivorus TaxID=297713 RepID=A0AAW0CPS9_9AGAR